MDDFPDIPDFLRLTAEQREAGWRGHVPRRHRQDLLAPKKVLDPATVRFLAEQKHEARIATYKRIAAMHRKKQNYEAEQRVLDRLERLISKRRKAGA